MAPAFCSICLMLPTETFHGLTRVDVPRRYVPDMVHVATEPNTSTELLVRRPSPSSFLFFSSFCFAQNYARECGCTGLMPGRVCLARKGFVGLSFISAFEDVLFSGYRETVGLNPLLYFQRIRSGTMGCTVFTTRAPFRCCWTNPGPKLLDKT